MKKLVVSLLEPILTIYIIISSLLGFIGGGFVFGLFPFGGFWDARLEFSVPGALAGLILSFIASLITTGTLFLLLDIRDLMRQQLRALKNLEQDHQRA
ncbi:MAG: hypothetical protein KatS3mg052_0010 [Candidatus Roseilinea sp.]|nr:MAG: hypothetical protein KatS3mg052_0010 [Candidatus Roseilinea sp.]